jgi:hypothetical protein
MPFMKGQVMYRGEWLSYEEWWERYAVKDKKVERLEWVINGW